MSSDKANLIDYIKTIFSHNQQLIELADTKANIVLGINSVLLPLIFGVTSINLLELVTRGFLLQALLLNISSVVALGFLLISVIFSTSVIKGRIYMDLKSNIFFQNIIETNIDDYIANVTMMNEDSIIEDYLREIYTLADINREKYEKHKWSLRFLVLGVFSIVLGYFALAIGNYMIIVG